MIELPGALRGHLRIWNHGYDEGKVPSKDPELRIGCAKVPCFFARFARRLGPTFRSSSQSHGGARQHPPPGSARAHYLRQMRTLARRWTSSLAAMAEGMRLDKADGGYSLLLECSTPVDDIVVASGDEPNGHFWETVAAFIAPSIIDKLELDSEGSMFAVYGKRRHLRRLQRELEPITLDPQRLREVLARAQEEGFTIEG